MIITWILFSLLMLLTIGSIVCLVKISLDADKQRKNLDSGNPDEYSKCQRALITMVIITAIFIVALIVMAMFVTADNKTPEAAVDNVVESTSAPVNDILPEPTEIIPEPTEEAVPEKNEPTPMYPEFDISVHEDDEYSDLYLLALVIYQEAGGNKTCDECRRRVADVVLNRVAHPQFPDTIKDNLLRKKQYGRLYWTGIKWPKRAVYDTEKEAVERAYRIAEEVLNGQHSDVYGKGYIWQAEFKQGKSGFWCCGHYFGKS